MTSKIVMAFFIAVALTKAALNFAGVEVYPMLAPDGDMVGQDAQ